MSPPGQRSLAPVSAAHSQLVRVLSGLAEAKPQAFHEMALRTRSPEVLDAIAALALPGAHATMLQEVGRALTEGLDTTSLATVPLDPRWGSELAALTALQVTDRCPDLLAAWGLWDWAAAQGEELLPPRGRDLRAQVAWALGGSYLEQLSSWASQDDLLGPDVRSEVRADLANPWIDDPRSASLPDWEGHLADLLGPRVTPVQVPAGAGAPFDRLTTRPTSRVLGDRMLSIILTTYRPDTSLLTAIRSLIAQTWQEWELVLVDDASGPAFADLLAEAVALDDRVRLIQLERNGGTYAARNAGLRSIGSADFVTFHDSDDWSHPQRLELTLEPLRSQPAVVATTGWGLKATDDLQLTRPGYRTVSRMAVSLVVRRDPVCTTLGFFDPVRKSADKEFKRRIVAAFPDGLVEVTDPLGIIRRGHSSLSASDHSFGWRHHSRRHYQQAYQPWHRKIRQGKASAHLDDRSERTFWAPPRWLVTDTTDRACERYDVVLVADYSLSDAVEGFSPTLREVLRDYDRVGLLQVDGPVLGKGPEPPTDPSILRRVRDGAVGWVYLDDAIEVARVVVLDPGVLHPGTDQRARWTPEQVELAAPSVLNMALDRPAATRRALSMFGVPPSWSDA